MDISKFGKIYQQLDDSKLHTLEKVYHPNVVFEDAAHRIEGWPALNAYLANLYQNVQQCQFDIHHSQQEGDTGFVTWTMHLQHPRLNNGRVVQVQGVSHLMFSDGKVIYHRDYFDLGEMLYENLPLIGKLIQAIKRRLGQ
ncbi:nuclear transport factor 2 family protein [Vibrio sp.]|uniref:nuclear transport factor 2 family protein n=1 Tax=Vibrio sp. TaxID=678 RepID=UPI003D0C981D